MALEYKSVAVQENSPTLTYHESVFTPAIVPVNLNLNDEHSIGRANLKRDTEGNVVADIYIDAHPAVESQLPQPPNLPTFRLATQGSDLMEDFEGTNYLMAGSITALSLLTLPIADSEEAQA